MWEFMTFKTSRMIFISKTPEKKPSSPLDCAACLFWIIFDQADKSRQCSTHNKPVVMDRRREWYEIQNKILHEKKECLSRTTIRARLWKFFSRKYVSGIWIWISIEIIVRLLITSFTPTKAAVLKEDYSNLIYFHLNLNDKWFFSLCLTFYPVFHSLIHLFYYGSQKDIFVILARLLCDSPGSI